MERWKEQYERIAEDIKTVGRLQSLLWQRWINSKLDIC